MKVGGYTFGAMLGLVACIPLFFALGYVAHREPSVETQLNHELKIAQADDVRYLFVASKGKYKGTTEDAFQVLSLYPTEKVMKAHGAPPHLWVRVTCNLWTTSGGTSALYEPDLAQRCTSEVVSFSVVQKAFIQVLADALKPTPKA